MLDWFRKTFAPETETETETESQPEPSSITGAVRTDYRPMSRMQLIANVQANTVQVEPLGAMDSVKTVAAINALNITDNQFAFYGSQGFIGYQTMAMLAQNWLIAKACSQPGKDATRKGWEVTSKAGKLSPEVLARIGELDKRHNITNALQEFSYFGRMFGVRHAMAVIDSQDEDFYTKPFNPDGIALGAYRGLTQIDPYWITPVLTGENASDPANRHFYDPDFWQVQGRKIHRSHLIIMRGPEVADILKPTYRYGGVSLVQQIFERVYCAERTANEAPQLAQTKRESIIKTDVKEALANQSDFDSVMRFWAETRDNYGVRVIGIDDEATQLETSLTGLDEVIMTQYQLVASIAGVPVTKLLGTVPKGFNSTGEYDEASYHEELETIQKHTLDPLLDRHYQCLFKSDRLLNQIQNYVVQWAPLDSLTEKEQAEVNKIKAEAGSALVGSGAIDGMDERNRIKADPKSGYNNLTDEMPEIVEEDAPSTD